MDKDQHYLSSSCIFTDHSIIIFLKNISVCIKTAKDTERKTGEQRTAHEPPPAENSPAGGREAGAHGLGRGEGRGQLHRTEVTEEGGEAAEGAERESRIKH